MATFQVGQAPWETANAGIVNSNTKQTFAVGQAPWETSLKENKIEPVTSSTATFPATKDESFLSGATKLVANIPSSAYNFVKGAVSSLNPVNAVKNVSEYWKGFDELTKESGGDSFKASVSVLKEIPNSVYSSLVPEATRQAISGDFEGARNTLTNDPVGQILPYLLTGKAMAEKAGHGTQFDNAISTIAKPVTVPAEGALNAIKNATSASTKFGVSQATGLAPETIQKVMQNPTEFTKEAQSTISRAGIADKVKTALDTRQATLTETGTGYQGIRATNAPIGVSPNLLADTIKNTTGLTIENGKLTISPKASIRDIGDVRAIQNIYDLYQPLFKRGALTSEEFLNLRTDLGNMAKFGRELTKSQPLENLSGIIRGKLNTEIRGKIPGLENLDTTFGSQISELNNLKKGILDAKGNLTDTGVNRIANALGKGKDQLVAKLEEIQPGITKQIGILKAVEDIQNSGGNKVGTYARAGGLIGGIATFNPYLIVGSILAIPDIAIPILRGIGMATPKITSTLNYLQIPFKMINGSPEIAQKLAEKDVGKVVSNEVQKIKDTPNKQGGFIKTGVADDLAKEAKKYKSAEYMNSQTYYHGGGKIDSFTDKGRGGVYLTPTESEAMRYAGQKGEVTQATISIKKPYVQKTEAEQFLIMKPEMYPKLVAKIKAQGYDALVSKDGKQIFVFDASKVKKTK